MAPPDADPLAHEANRAYRERRIWLRIEQASFPRSFSFSSQRTLFGGAPGIHATLSGSFAVSFRVADACVVTFRARCYVR